MPDMSSESFRPRTRAVHAGTRRSQYGELAEALFLTQGFRYDSAEQAESRFIDCGPDEFIYGRYGNPTTRMFEDRIASLEGTEDAFATGSGMAAINGVLFSVLKAGDRVVASRALFGSTLWLLDMLKGFGVTVDLVDGTDLDQWRAQLSRPANLVYFETLSNPMLEMVDLPEVTRLGHAAGALVVADNVFVTPVFSRAIAHGVDAVVYSATKHIDGSGRALGGVICGTHEFVRGTVEPYVKHSGGAMSPFNAWLMLGSLVTMDLRVRAQAASACALAKALSERPGVRVIHPSLPDYPQHELASRMLPEGGTMILLDTGSKEAAFRVLDRLRVALISNNLGDARTIITHPATTTHRRIGEEGRAKLGIGPGMLRLSVGLEDTADLIADFEQAIG